MYRFKSTSEEIVVGDFAKVDGDNHKCIHSIHSSTCLLSSRNTTWRTTYMYGNGLILPVKGQVLVRLGNLAMCENLRVERFSEDYLWCAGDGKLGLNSVEEIGTVDLGEIKSGVTFLEDKIICMPFKTVSVRRYDKHIHLKGKGIVILGG